MLAVDDWGRIRRKEERLKEPMRGRLLGGPACAESGGCFSHAKTGIFTKAYLDLSEEEQEMSLIREKEKTHRE